MWDVLVEHHAAEGEDEALRLELIERVKEGSVDDALLDRVHPMIERAIGHSVQLSVIPAARDIEEQQAILQRLAQWASSKDKLYFDVTHGFRHLGMLALTAAQFLESTRRATIEAVYYGAFDMSEGGLTPVLRLDGLLAIARWVKALAHFDASGDYGVFAPLLEADGFPADKARCLVKAAFYERTTQIPPAAKQLQTVLQALGAPLKGASELFRERLRDRLKWAQEQDLAKQQRLLALRALERRDYLRAAILGLEATITLQCLELGRDPYDYQDRTAADERLQEELRQGDHPGWKKQAYWTLKNLRNAMAHGLPPSYDEIKRILADPEQLKQRLQAEIQRLT
jgi:CRISPR-associated Csx2 family protein